MDISKLKERVRECMRGLPTDIDPASATPASARPTPLIRALVRVLVNSARMEDAIDELESQDRIRVLRVARMRDQAPVYVTRACMKPPLFVKNAVGSGSYGKVYRLGTRKGLVPKVVKVVSLAKRYDIKHTLRAWRREVEWATVAGDAGVGPRVHDCYVCMHEGEPHGFMVMDFVDGTTLEEYRQTASPANVLKAERNLEAKIATLHTKGIAHADLHSRNVMVINTGKTVDVLIVDYGFAVNLEQLQENDTKGVRDEGREMENVVNWIARQLIHEGTVRM